MIVVLKDWSYQHFGGIWEMVFIFTTKACLVNKLALSLCVNIIPILTQSVAQPISVKMLYQIVSKNNCLIYFVMSGSLYTMYIYI